MLNLLPRVRTGLPPCLYACYCCCCCMQRVYDGLSLLVGILRPGIRGQCRDIAVALEFLELGDLVLPSGVQGVHPQPPMVCMIDCIQTIAAGMYSFRVVEVSPPGMQELCPSSSAPPAPPFLFLHGFLGCADDWLHIMRGLATAGHRCC